MNKPLDDLFNQADRQLETLEAESREKELSQVSRQEVDKETATKFNRFPTRVTSHPFWKWVAAVLFLFVAARIYMGMTMPRATGPYHLVRVTVRDSAISWFGGLHWMSSVTADVALPDGRIVIVHGNRALLVRPGTPVMLRFYDTGAIWPDRSF